MIVDKQSRVRYPSPLFPGVEIVVDAKGTEALSQEKVDVIGGWTDDTGSGGVPTKQLVLFPVANTLWGTEGWIDGAKNYDRDALGNITRITRLRQKRKILYD